MLTSRIKLALIAALWCGGIHAALGQAAAKEQEAKLIGILKSNAEYNQKADACRELARIGTADAVPALAALLTDEKLAHMARYGLETVPSPAVDEALRAALGKVKGRSLAGVIGSIGVRHDEKAVTALTGLLKDSDADVAQTAARALGMIGTTTAAQGLQAALTGASPANQLALCEGLFRCAEALAAKGSNDKAIAIYDSLRDLKQAPHQVQAGAWRGAILTRQQKDGLPLLLEAFRGTHAGLVAAAERIAIEMKGAEVSKALADELAKSPAERQLLLCNVLGKRGDVAALPALLGLSKAGAKPARLAALRAAIEIGNASAATTLVELLKDPDGDLAQAAGVGLASLAGAEVDASVLRMLDSQDTAVKLKILEVVRQRRIMAALPLLLKIRDDKDEAMRSAATRCYAELASETELPALLEKIVKNTNAGEIAALEKSLAAICGTASDPKTCVQKLIETLAKASPEAKSALLRTLRVAGGAEAIKAVRAAVEDSDKDIHTTAIRVLSDWKTGDAAPLLLDLAVKSSGQVDKILCLRGYLGMAARKDIPAPERLAISRAAAPLIQRDEEKLLLLGALGSLANSDSLALITAYLDEPAVKREAVTSVIAIAAKRAKNQNVAITRSSLEKVLKVAADNPAQVKQAQELLKLMESEK